MISDVEKHIVWAVEPFDVRPKIQVLPFNALCAFFADTCLKGGSILL
jgi:hypothetical protein